MTSVCLSVCPSVSLSVCLCVCPFCKWRYINLDRDWLCLSVCLCVCVLVNVSKRWTNTVTWVITTTAPRWPVKLAPSQALQAVVRVGPPLTIVISRCTCQPPSRWAAAADTRAHRSWRSQVLEWCCRRKDVNGRPARQAVLSIAEAVSHTKHLNVILLSKIFTKTYIDHASCVLDLLSSLLLGRCIVKFVFDSYLL